IDKIKIGNFLRELRNEKGITQEKLAEKYGVSSRSVSRWENGSTMPDLGILVELADYYQIDIGEIIDGERKSENMNKETKETLLKVADYAEMEKMMLVRKKEFSFLGKILFILFAVSLLLSAIAFNLDKVVFSLIAFAFVIIFACVLVVFSKSYEK
ncbi:MAG: helix-turn-helix domain-containing protein, partial [Huintestinicola sp.]